MVLSSVDPANSISLLIDLCALSSQYSPLLAPGFAVIIVAFVILYMVHMKTAHPASGYSR
ncbi:hypothetical protein BJX63DRAFT_394476 [Aspergillus granulosus]|uniref:Uncharacterized protein n=1 Tax=Aspergillus granulosus TaxID=176169 RepID=A0ABR4HCM2_9EURO